MNDILKNRLVGRAGRRPAGDSGIGENNVEFPEIFGQGCEEPLAIFPNSHVCAVATRGWSEFGDCCIERLLVATGNGDLRALSNEKSGCGQTDATVAAGNKSLFPCEFHNASFLKNPNTKRRFGAPSPISWVVSMGRRNTFLKFTR